MAKIFLGGISASTTKESIEAYFGQYGTVIDAVAMMKDGRPRCFGFVTFEDQGAADAVLAEVHQLDGQTIEVKSAVPRGQQEPPTNPYLPQAGMPRPSRAPPRTDITDKVFVGGLSSTLKDDEFTAYFSQYGNIIDSVVMKDRATGKPKGFGFVQYDNTDSVDLVMEAYESHSLDGKWVEVKRAVPRERMAARPAPLIGMGRAPGGCFFGKGGGKPFNGGYLPVPSSVGGYNPSAPPGQRFGNAIATFGGGGKGGFGGGFGGGYMGKGYRASPY